MAGSVGMAIINSAEGQGKTLVEAVYTTTGNNNSYSRAFFKGKASVN